MDVSTRVQVEGLIFGGVHMRMLIRTDTITKYLARVYGPVPAHAAKPSRGRFLFFATSTRASFFLFFCAIATHVLFFSFFLLRNSHISFFSSTFLFFLFPVDYYTCVEIDVKI